MCPPFFLMMILRLRSRRLFLSQRLIFLIVLSLLSACTSAVTPAPFIPPTAPVALIQPTFIINPTENAVVHQPAPLATLPPTERAAENCVNNLTFAEDLTVSDYSYIAYGASIDKRWLVQNSGTCNWDETYRLRHIGGATLGAPEEIMLYPAKSGAQAIVQIFFTAPFADGEYVSAWQAFDPYGFAFGDPLFLRIEVAAP